MIGSVSTRAAAAMLPGRISAELTKDPRIISAKSTVAVLEEGSEVTFQIRIEAETGEGPFELNLGVTELTVELLGLQA